MKNKPVIGSDALLSSFLFNQSVEPIKLNESELKFIKLKGFFSLLLFQTNMAVNNQPRSITPEGQKDYDVTRMREDDFERLAVYIVPDVPCERGTNARAEKTLPRSLTLKPSLVLSTPSAKVCIFSQIFFYSRNFKIFFCVCVWQQTEGVWSTGVIPRGTRFGPFEGIPTPNYPSDKSSWRYFWRVCICLYYIFFPIISSKASQIINFCPFHCGDNQSKLFSSKTIFLS